MKRFLPVGVIIVALLIILLVVRRCTSSSASNYQTATVTRGPITQLVTATGTLNPVVNVQRSEEHTSELQSRGHLVCRLLLEKKNKQQTSRRSPRVITSRTRGSQI